MGYKRKSASLAAIVVITASAVAGCVAPPERRVAVEREPAADICPSPDLTGSIRIAMSSPLTVYAPLLLADQVGAFRDAGLDVQLERVPTSDALALVGQGKLDAQVTSYSTAHFNLFDAGVDMRFVQPFDNQVPSPPGTPLPGYWAPKDLVGSAQNPDFSALRGKKVSTPTGGTGASAKLLGDALAGVGLTLNDVSLSSQVGPDALVALENGAVDAAWISAPLEIEAAKNADLVPLLGYAPGVTGTSLISGPTLLDRPEVLVRYMQVLKNITERYLQGDYRKNPETVSMLAKAAETSDEVIRGSEPLNFDPAFSMTGVEDYLAGLQKFLAGRDELKYDEPIPPAQLVDGRFAEALEICPAYRP